MNRWKAAAIHLSISVVLAALVGSLLYFVWFPAPYFVAAGGGGLILLLMGVDVVIGPLITLLVVNRNKARKLLLLDLSIIGALQMIAFGYGLHVITNARPVFIVVEQDRLVIVSAQDLSDADLAKGNRPEFRIRSWAGPVLVGALPPQGKGADDLLFKTLGSGKDIDQMPLYYMPYDQVIDGTLKKYAKPLASLKKATDSQRAYLSRLQAQMPGQTLEVLPLQRGDNNYAAIISTVSKRPIAVLPIDPW